MRTYIADATIRHKLHAKHTEFFVNDHVYQYASSFYFYTVSQKTPA